MTQTKTLVLVPTQLELELLKEFAPARLAKCDVSVCGFGPVASAMESASILASNSVERLFLVGIAGSYDLDRLPVGSVISDFDQVECDGVGAGASESIQLPSEMNLPICQIEGSDVFESLPLKHQAQDSEKKMDAQSNLLTVCRASGDEAEADSRRQRFPNAVAEDMEGFAVALAAARWQIPITIIRGISNRAGDRDQSHWEIRPAMQAAADCLTEVLAE